MEDLHPSIYLCSETQERFMWVCSPEVTPMILDHYNHEFDLPAVSKGARASVIGKIRNDGQYIVHNGNEEIVNAPASEVTKGFLYDRPSKPQKREYKEPNILELDNYNSILIDLLAHENLSSREPVFEQYDKQVQGRVKLESGFADSSVLAPFNSKEYPEEIRNTGIALSTDHNPLYGLIDPYWGGVNATVEAMRNVAAVGATPHALSDCLCFGNPEKPSQMWEFVESVRGVTDACNTITLKHSPTDPTPIIAGNVSFYNESKNGAIPPSPIISCLGLLKDVNKAITMHFQKTNSLIIMVGERKNECGGSAYYNLYGKLGNNIPRPDLDEVKKQIFALTDSIDKELILSCHDISDGGLAIALSEMTFDNNIGCEVKISGKISDNKILFSETGGFILEVPIDNFKALNSIFSNFDLKLSKIGTTGGNKIKINNVVSLDIDKAKDKWLNGLREKL
jgi:phosphoribosylformylglycinamidine (FGAM) synthase-like enzyme